MEHTDISISEKKIELDDILSLDISQIMILFFLSFQISDTVRYTLLQDLNKFVFPEAKLSASSFYNTLDKLEKLGLLDMKKNKTGRVKSIRGRPEIKNVLSIISQYTSIISIDLGSILTDFIAILDNSMNNSPINNLLLIDIEEFYDFGLTTILKRYSEEVFLLSDDESFARYSNRGFKQVHQSQIINGKIREPDKIFDCVFILDFQIKNDIYGMNEKALLTEALRVTKKDGLIIVIGMDELPITNNFILDSVLQKVQKSSFFNVINLDLFKDLIRSVSHFEPEFINVKGMIIAKIKVA